MTVTDLDVHRNADFLRELRLVATNQSGNITPIDLTSATLECVVRDAPGGSLIAVGTCTLVEPLDGRFNLQLDGGDFDGYGNDEVVALAAYDVRLTLSGVRTIVLAGHINIIPGSV